MSANEQIYDEEKICIRIAVEIFNALFHKYVTGVKI